MELNFPSDNKLRIKDKAPLPKCPLLGGSTVFINLYLRNIEDMK